ncbi:MAG: hypothetical protein M1824_002023 [Vezdaea acicularis]|nr:MAG: hypothetical protein M1824_002023 [Vezdaea acicularis]
MPPVLEPPLKVLLWIALIATFFPGQVLAARGIIVGQEWERYQYTRGHIPQDPPVGMRGMIGWDPEAQIRCVGEVPTFLDIEELLPDDYHRNDRVWLGFSAVYKNLRELCAKPAYGGSIKAFSAGGYCARHTSPPTVLFERLPPGGAAMTDVFRRVFLYCQHHCFCIEGDYQDLLEQGRPAAEILDQETYGGSLQIVTDHNGVQREIHNADYRIDEALPPRANLFRLYPPPSAFSPIPVYFMPERQARALGPSSSQGRAVGVVTVWMNPFEGGMPIFCRGEMNHPSVLEGSPTSRQAVCAADWFGGSKKGNVGLLCRPDPIEGSYTFGYPEPAREGSVAQ